MPGLTSRQRHRQGAMRRSRTSLAYILWALPLLVLATPACEPDLDPVDAEITFSHAEELVVNIGPRRYGTPGGQQAGAYILDTFTAYGLEDPHFQDFLVGSTPARNVIATITGTTYPEDIFLIGAHYDTISGGVGSIDNATGVATMLELARYFSAHPPAYTLRFVAFDAEEIGVVGSGHYYDAAVLSGELDDTVLMLCLDMTQTNETDPLSPVLFFVLSANPALNASFEAAKAELGLNASLIIPVPPDLAAAVSGGVLRSDIRHWVDDPLLLAWPWAFSVDYHTIPGSIDQIDQTGLGISTKCVLDTVRNLQAYTPGELAVEAGAPPAVDGDALGLLRAVGGLKPPQ